MAPQVVFDTLSTGNTIAEIMRKFRFYERYGVEEYYLYNPDTGELSGWQRQGEILKDIASMDGWISPRLDTRFERDGDTVVLYQPDGKRFATYVELIAQREQARQNAEQARQRAERLAARLRDLGIDPEAE